MMRKYEVTFILSPTLDETAFEAQCTKLAELVEREGATEGFHCAKFSEDKETYPGRKQVWRSRDREGAYTGDEICMAEEERSGLSACLLVPIMERGTLTYRFPALEEVRERALDELGRLPAPHRRLESPNTYPLGWSAKLQRRFSEMRRKSGVLPFRRSSSSGD